MTATLDEVRAIMAPGRTPLKVDPKLWEAFAEDREMYPYEPKTAKSNAMPEKCLCGVRVRPRRADPKKYPGAVPYHSHGLCTSCYSRERRKARKDK